MAPLVANVIATLLQCGGLAVLVFPEGRPGVSDFLDLMKRSIFIFIVYTYDSEIPIYSCLSILFFSDTLGCYEVRTFPLPLQLRGWFSFLTVNLSKYVPQF